MHRNDSVELFRFKPLAKSAAQLVLAAWLGAKADDTQCRAAALAAADGDTRHRADHVFETRHRMPRPICLIGQRCPVSRAVKHVKGPCRIEAEIFRAALTRNIAPRFQKAVDRDALFEMF